MIVLVSRGLNEHYLVHRTIAAMPALAAEHDRIPWHRALDLLDPTYRTTSFDDPNGILDHLSLEFATDPGVRHIVRINGVEHGGFQKSDLKFARLLLLAATRATDPDVDGGGWVGKDMLHDDDKRHEIAEVRTELLSALPHEHLSTAETKALVKTSGKRDGTVRLAVDPKAIIFDQSLAQLRPVGLRLPTGTSTRTPGATEHARDIKRALQTFEHIQQQIAGMGIPIGIIDSGLRRRGGKRTPR